MSNEEAIKRLEESKSTIQPYYYINEALDVAIKALQQQPCEDCISRQEALKYSHIEYDDDGEGHRVVYAEDIEELPPVTPQQKIGKWIKNRGYDKRDNFYTCSECGRSINIICGDDISCYPYCHCGAKMEVDADANSD